MSHIVTIQTQVRDAVAVEAAYRRLGLAKPASGTEKLFSGHETGLPVQLPGWRYPIVCKMCPFAMELRSMQMITEVGVAQNTTTIFLMPTDFVTVAKSATATLSSPLVAS